MEIILFVFTLAFAALYESETSEEELSRLQWEMEVASTQLEMNEASGNLAEYWERMLKKEEAKIIESSADEEAAELFKNAQINWRNFRESEARFRSDSVRGGSMQPLVYNSFYADMTEQRLNDLRFYFEPDEVYDCEEAIAVPAKNISDYECDCAEIVFVPEEPCVEYVVTAEAYVDENDEPEMAPAPEAPCVEYVVTAEVHLEEEEEEAGDCRCGEPDEE